MVLLSVMPCSDDLDTHDLSSISIDKVAHGQQEGSTESCSPICLCNCCGQSIVQPALTAFEVKVPQLEINKLVPSYPCALTERAANIWQPPKIG